MKEDREIREANEDLHQLTADNCFASMRRLNERKDAERASLELRLRIEKQTQGARP